MPKTCWSVILKQNKKLCQCICKHGKLANNSLRYKIQNISLKSSQLLALPIFIFYFIFFWQRKSWNSPNPMKLPYLCTALVMLAAFSLLIPSYMYITMKYLRKQMHTSLPKNCKRLYKLHLEYNLFLSSSLTICQNPHAEKSTIGLPTTLKPIMPTNCQCWSEIESCLPR